MKQKPVREFFTGIGRHHGKVRELSREEIEARYGREPLPVRKKSAKSEADSKGRFQ